MTEEEAAKYFAEWHKEGELTEDELKQVAGGAGLTCPCSSFYPEDGDWSNKTQSNCKYGISAHKNGVSCPGAKMIGPGGPGLGS